MLALSQNLTRIAFIIGDGVSGGGPLPGVSADHRAYRYYLQSDTGGAWRSDEIIPVRQTIAAADLEEILALGATFDYALVVFTGHGFVGLENGVTYCCINDSESIPCGSLETGATRQLTIIDGCRLTTSLAPYRQVGKTVIGEAHDEARARRYRAACRAAYDELVARAPVGTGFIYACSPDTAAGDTRAGGLFSSSLIEVASDWASSIGSETGEVTDWLSVGDAFTATTDTMAALRLPQTPVEELGDAAALPFAVA